MQYPFDVDQVRKAFNAAYQYIGSDLFDATGEDTIPREALFEVILDGDHWRGNLPKAEESKFGAWLSDKSTKWEDIAALAPLVLPFKAYT